MHEAINEMSPQVMVVLVVLIGAVGWVCWGAVRKYRSK